MQEEEVHSLLKTNIDRLMQEALNNVAKHSKADLVHFALRKTGDPIQLMAQDNGQGFDVDEVLSIEGSKKGIGLITMRASPNIRRNLCN